MKLDVVVYLVREWEIFHRRPMLEALARSGEGKLRFLCVNPVALLPLRPNYWLSAARAWSKARVGPSQVSSNLHVFTPTCWLPSRVVQMRKGRVLHNSIVGQQILKVLMELGMFDGKRVAWVFRPEQSDWLGLIGEQHVVYECYDEYQLDNKTGELIPGMEALEKSLLQRVGIVFTVSQPLYEKRNQWHPKVYFVPNGVDANLFSKALDDKTMPIAPELACIRRPIIGYIGHLDRTVDYPLLEYIADTRPDWSLVLIGPVMENISVENLKRKPNVHFLGWRPYHQLPFYSKGFDVFILAALVNEYIQFSNPLKIWEQLAAGNVVVSADLREVRRLKDIVMIARDKAEFIRSIETALSGNNRERIERGIRAARERSWDAITRKAVDILVKEFR